MVPRRRKRRSSRRSRRRSRWLKACIVAGVAALLAGTVNLAGRQPEVRVTVVAETSMETLFASPSSGIVSDGTLWEGSPLYAGTLGIDGESDIIPGGKAPAQLLEATSESGTETVHAVVPEPLSIFLLGSGLLGILGFRVRKT